MPAIPESTKTSLAQRLRAHAKQNWPQLAAVHVRYHGQFAYVEGELAGGERLPLMRLRYGGSAHRCRAERKVVSAGRTGVGGWGLRWPRGCDAVKSIRESRSSSAG